LANIKWEGVPDFGGYYPEGSLAELECRSRQNKSKFDSDLGTVGRVESVSGGLKHGCGGKKIFSSYYASISRKQYKVRPKSKGSRNCSKSYNKTISNRATLV